ncbi:MAG: RMD1 family protein [Chlamydiales bacterium]|nr:RMD1 family protein [Chlamydiia bacterium]MCP5506993.1 RMD1 family protein [Chlamydiales bacterium]
MDCSAHCTAYDYKIKSFFESLRSRFTTTLYRDVLHLEIPHDGKANGDVFFFPYGAFVAWNTAFEEIESLIKEIEPYQESPLKEVESDDFTYDYGHDANFTSDHITLQDDRVLTKLAFSHALAQSVKLGAFEIAIQETFKTTKLLPESLAKHGNISLSRKELRQKLGELFVVRSSINLHSDVLDTPEFYWEHPEFEDVYTMTAFELDIHSRTETLNQQLDVIHELFDMLSNELNHQHSSRLEWAIIILIVVEVLILLGHDIFSII